MSLPGEPDRNDRQDSWRFPQGTKLWKEFTRDGVRVETRLLQKVGPPTRTGRRSPTCGTTTARRDGPTRGRLERARDSARRAVGRGVHGVPWRAREPRARVLGGPALVRRRGGPSGSRRPRRARLAVTPPRGRSRTRDSHGARGARIHARELRELSQSGEARARGARCYAPLRLPGLLAAVEGSGSPAETATYRFGGRQCDPARGREQEQAPGARRASREGAPDATDRHQGGGRTRGPSPA